MIQHTHIEEMDKVRDEVAILLEMLPVEQRLAGLSAEDRLTGLSPEDRLAGLSDQERAQLLRLLKKSENGD